MIQYDLIIDVTCGTGDGGRGTGDGRGMDGGWTGGEMIRGDERKECPEEREEK